MTITLSDEINMDDMNTDEIMEMHSMTLTDSEFDICLDLTDIMHIDD